MMSAKNLRDSILQMAVEGKLVEQREEEGTAADLLASIREQRAQLVREKKAKPVKGGESVIWRDDDGHWFERRGKGEAVCIDDEIPFDIPDSWCWARLSMIAKYVQRGKSPKYSTIEKYPVIAQKCNQWSGFSIDRAKFIDPDTLSKYDRERFLQDGDLLWNSTGLGTLGRMAIYQSSLNPYGIAVADSHVTVIRTDFSWTSYQYLFSYFTGPSVQRGIEDKASGSTKQKELSLSTILEYLTPVPPLLEQVRIVSKIDELMPLVDDYSKVQEQREQLDRELPVKLRKSILQAAVEGKLTEQTDDDEPASLLLAGIREKRAQLVREGKAKPVKGGESIIYRDDAGHWFERRGKSDPVCIDEEIPFDIPFDIPDTWCWARLNSLATLTRGSGIKRSEVREEGLPCVRYGELYTTYDTVIDAPHSFVDQAVFDAAKKIGPDDLVLTLTGENDIDIGRAVINRTGETIAFGGDLLAVTDTQMNREYLLVALHSPALGKQRTQAAAGNIIVHLGAEKVGRFLIPVPPLPEQERIVEKWNSVALRE